MEINKHKKLFKKSKIIIEKKMHINYNEINNREPHMRFYYSGSPISKARYRTNKGKAYDPQDKIKKIIKWHFADQFRQQGYLKPLEGPIYATVDITYKPPTSWPKKRVISTNFKSSRPDIDNVVKFYFDVLNKIAYRDDSQIVAETSVKRYSSKSGVEINLFQLEDVEMINEHAITYKNELSLVDLDYIIKKANRLGLTNRQLSRVYQQEDEEGKHIYFEVEGLKEKEEKVNDLINDNFFL